MKLGDVLKKEREQRGIALAQAATRLGLSETDYRLLEDGNSPAEKWGPLLSQIAIKLETPMSRLIRAEGHQDQCGRLIRLQRERKQKSPAELAGSLGLSHDAYDQIERGESPIETYGPLLLSFAELIEQPVFNLLYPCSLPLEKLKDYP
jgi:transcriptional regulator with XRE-family HTH domain